MFIWYMITAHPTHTHALNCAAWTHSRMHVHSRIVTSLTSDVYFHPRCCPHKNFNATCPSDFHYGYLHSGKRVGVGAHCVPLTADTHSELAACSFPCGEVLEQISVGFMCKPLSRNSKSSVSSFNGEIWCHHGGNRKDNYTREYIWSSKSVISTLWSYPEDVPTGK